MRAEPSKVVWWPALVAAGAPALLIVADAAFGADLLWALIAIPIVMVLTAGAAVGAAVVGILACVRGAGRRALSAAVLPGLVALVVIFPGLLHICYDAGERLSFEAHVAGYRRRVAALQTGGEPKLIVFERGGWSGVGSAGVVYDESDEIALPADERSKAWLRRAERSMLACEFSADPLRGHFYTAWFWC